jgi:hypothetical protein
LVLEGTARFAADSGLGEGGKKDTRETVERQEEVETWDAGNVVPKQR